MQIFHLVLWVLLFETFFFTNKRVAEFNAKRDTPYIQTLLLFFSRSFYCWCCHCAVAQYILI